MNPSDVPPEAPADLREGPSNPELSSAGASLVSALAEEASLAALACKHPDDDELFRRWARARRVVEERQAAYCETLERCGFPASPIRSIIET